jgi:monoamine oxidase
MVRHGGACRPVPAAGSGESRSRRSGSLLGISNRKLARLLVSTHEHDWNLDPFSRGAYSYQAVGGSSGPARLAEPVEETLFFAGEATEPDQNGTVPGAIASGRRAARALLR